MTKVNSTMDVDIGRGIELVLIRNQNLLQLRKHETT